MAEKKKVTVTTETKKPTGLSITRSGEKFTISWKIGDKNYKDGQQVYWRTNQTKKGKWFKLTCGTTTTSKAVELDFDNYIPHTKKLLSKIRFKIRGNREEHKTETSKQETTHKCTWSDYAEKEFDIYKPKRPKVSATLSEEFANRCSFHWTAANPSKDHRPFERVQWQSRLLKDSKVTKGKDAFKKSTKGVAGEYKSGTGGASGTEVIIEDSSRVNGATPYTRWFRARSRGPGGSSKWVYAKHVYSKSNPASNVEVSTWKKDNGYLVSVKWTTSRNAAKPINSIVVQYGIGTPGAGMTTPAGLSWNDVLTLKPKDGTDKAVFTVDEFLENDQVLFVRINTQHDGVTTPGTAVIARVGALSTPTLTNVVPVEQTHRATITATNESEVPGSFLAVTYKTDAEPDAIFIGIIEPGETQAVVQAPDWGTGEKSFGVRAFVGQYTAQTRSDGVTIYTITAYDGKKRMSSALVWDNGAVPPAPTGVAAVPTETPGTVRVSWNNPWTAADGVELSWADHADAWESTEPPESYTVSSAYAAAWNIVGLEVGKTWFIRVRLIAGDPSDPTPGPWSEIISQNLASAPNIPVLTLSEAIIAADGTVTASWGFASSDGTAQAYAEICEATINETTGVITYGDPKWTTLTAQHIDINAAEAEWTTGETYNLCVRVQSASGEFSDGWSAPVPITIAEPLTATITQTSLETITVPDDETEGTTRTVTALTDMPFTITVTGAGETGETTVAIERAESFFLERPDERSFTGYQEETVALFTQTGEAQIVINNEDLIGTLDDGAQYRIVADVSDGIGQTAREELEFEVHWSHQAVEPTATVEIDNENLIAKITPIAPAEAYELTADTEVIANKKYFEKDGEDFQQVTPIGTENPEALGWYELNDTCDIYRLSVDRPELIFEGAEFGTMYVDPYPALGEMGGHRIVFRTANGDYITEDNTIAWADYTQEETGGVDTMFNIIDFDGNQVRLMYDITIDAGWEKDFQQTKYLGGHIQGDWNAAVSRTGSVGGSLIVTQDQETIQNLRRLADYPGICHVRTRDGSSYAADVQVSEARDMGRDVIRSEFTLSITRVDPEGFDGLTYADWQAGTPNE